MTPPGYRPHTRRSPLTDPWEPLFARDEGDAIRLALVLRESHCNSRGAAHGGLVAALADNAMGLSAIRAAQRRPGFDKADGVTASLTLDFIGSASAGESLEFVPTVLRVGRTLAFVDCRVVCGLRLVARASATFSVRAAGSSGPRPVSEDA